MSLIDDLYGIVPDALLAELERLPKSLTLVRIPYYRAGEHVVAGHRGAFNARLKERFLQHIGNTQRPALIKMGLNDKLIERMKHDGKINTHDAAAADCTVDHILSLNFGGRNTFDNMVLLPAAINKLKNDLEAAQIRKNNPVQGTIITIVPADPNDKVPFVSNGYQRIRKLENV